MIGLIFVAQKLTNVAQNYAETIAKRDSLVHSNNGYGENLFASWGKEPNGREPVTAFYNEIKKYNFNSPGFSMATGKYQSCRNPIRKLLLTYHIVHQVTLLK